MVSIAKLVRASDQVLDRLDPGLRLGDISWERDGSNSSPSVFFSFFSFSLILSLSIFLLLSLYMFFAQKWIFVCFFLFLPITFCLAFFFYLECWRLVHSEMIKFFFKSTFTKHLMVKTTSDQPKPLSQNLSHFQKPTEYIYGTLKRDQPSGEYTFR